jgi:hypothetical protein
MTGGGDVGETRVLKPANQNPWYVLMTLYGEQDGEEIDWDLHKKNRAAWNAWSCQAMSDEERAKAALTSKVLVQELSAWPEVKEQVARLHRAVWEQRNGAKVPYPGLPDAGATVNLRGVTFQHRFITDRAVFVGLVFFRDATFSRGDVVLRRDVQRGGGVCPRDVQRGRVVRRRNVQWGDGVQHRDF